MHYDPAALVAPSVLTSNVVCDGKWCIRHITLLCSACRERKRSRVDTLEGDISSLESQIADLRVRQAENADLEQQNRCVPWAAHPPEALHRTPCLPTDAL